MGPLRQQGGTRLLAYIGCALFGLIFLLMTAHANGAMGSRVSAMLDWLHGWAPFSYLILGMLLLAPIACIKVMHSWPKRKEPEDPMAKYRHATDVMED